MGRKPAVMYMCLKCGEQFKSKQLVWVHWVKTKHEHDIYEDQEGIRYRQTRKGLT